ncbi:MAG: cytochrome c [Myxococcales bacterium]|nr:cytochrome c [Myxococcales bacterium]
MSLALLGCSAEVSPFSVDYDKVEVPIAQLSSDEARARGRTLFKEKCALCHGDRADGNGVRSQGLSRKPVDFGSPGWRSNATAITVFEVLSEGKRGTSMPAWPTLSDGQKWDLVAYVLSVAEDGP